MVEHSAQDTTLQERAEPATSTHEVQNRRVAREEGGRHRRGRARFSTAAPPTSAPTDAGASRTEPGIAAVGARGAGVPRTVTGPAGRLAAVGTWIVVVGAWGGLAPFLAPALGLSADGRPSWLWDLPHALLWLVPGAVACLAGAAVLGHVPATRRGRGRVGTGAVGLVVLACGAWFVIGPSAWTILKTSAAVFVPADPLRALVYRVVYSYGPGLVLVLFGGLVMGWGWRGRPRPA